MTRPAASSHWALVLAIVLAATWLWTIRFDGFIASDEGVLGQSAERVLAGELPHLDFDDTYTGGLAMAHAAVFRLLGSRSAELRNFLFLASLLYLIAYGWLLAQDLAAPVAALALLLALSWSLVCYFASMPSWYNLFFAVFGLCALRQLAATRRRSWLLVVGMAGGLSALCKITGFFYLGGALFAVFYQRQLEQRTDERRFCRPSLPMTALLACLTITCVAGLVAILGKLVTTSSLLFFAAPCLAVLAVLWREEATPKAAPGMERARQSLQDMAILSFGAAVPWLLFLLPYLGEAGLQEIGSAFFHGLLVAPTARASLAAFPLPPLMGFVPALPLVLLVVAAWRVPGRWPTVLVALSCGLWLVLGSQLFFYVAVWRFVRLALPLAVLVACWRLWTSRSSRDGALFQVLAVTAFCSLVQLPYSRGIYYCYVAPLLVLTLAAWLAREQVAGTAWAPRNKPALVALAIFLGLFATFFLFRANLADLGVRWVQRQELAWLLPERVGLAVPRAHQEAYATLVRWIADHDPTPRPILALPDLPQLPFFAERPNPTRNFYDFLAQEPRRLDAEFLSQVGIVVINHRPEFSSPLDETELATLRSAFPEARALGPLEIRWRSQPSSGGSR